jgi:hypothetical protein
MTAFGNKLATAGIALVSVGAIGIAPTVQTPPRPAVPAVRLAAATSPTVVQPLAQQSNVLGALLRTRGPGVIAAIALSIAELRATATENCAPCMHVPTTAREPKAESPRTRIVVSALMARAVLIACATVRTAPLAELARPARNRGPAITGAGPAL